MRPPRPLADRMWEKVDTSDTCWVFTGGKTSNGYGHLNRGRKGEGMALAHRVAYEDRVGPIPEGLVIDHLCRNKACVNPAHLEPVTHLENILRSETPNVLIHLSGMCRRGHPHAEFGRLRAGRVAGIRCTECAKMSARARYRVSKGKTGGSRRS